VPAALWRKHRYRELTSEEVASLIDDFEWDYYDRFVRVGVTTSVLVASARVVARHPLRAYDAVQLASAHAAREAHSGVDLFATFDQALATAAASEGFALLG
jgi:predicted nucleic acid-binding protein